jgi:hypothetical protein
MTAQFLAHMNTLSNRALIARVKYFARCERAATAQLVAHLVEFDERRLYLPEGCSSLFTYCTQVLNLSEHAAYSRIEATRAARRFPEVIVRLADGSVHLTGIVLIGPHLTMGNHRDLLQACTHKSRREIEVLIARLKPLPPVPSSIRRLPAPRENEGSGKPDAASSERTPAVSELELSDQSLLTIEPASAAGETTTQIVTAQPDRSAPAPAVAGASPAASASSPPTPPAPPHRAVVSPLSPGHFRVQFTASAETYEKLQRLRELLRHQVLDGDPAIVIDLALTTLLEKVSRRKYAAIVSPRAGKAGARREGSPGNRPEAQQPSGGAEVVRGQSPEAQPRQPSRHIPAQVRRIVWLRDEGQCAFRCSDGRRCEERNRLEFHHVRPHAANGGNAAENIQLRCRAHNAYESDAWFGTG